MNGDKQITWSERAADNTPDIIAAANKGKAWAQNWLGVHHCTGEDVPRDLVAGAEWLRKAAEQDDPDAQANLGELHREGIGVQKDLSEARKWYLRAAFQGHCNAQVILGSLYEELGEYGDAVHWYRRGAEQGSATAQNRLGVLCFEGRGVPENYVEAYKWYNLAAAQGVAGALEARKTVAKKLTRTQLAEGQQRAADFVPEPEYDPESQADSEIGEPETAEDTGIEAQAKPLDSGKDLTHLLERLEAFEERAGVRLEALFAYISPDIDWLTVNGELHPRDGVTIKQDINVHVDAYDSSGRLVAKSQTTLSADGFFGFEAFDESVKLPIRELSKIRVYPKPNV